MTAEPSVDSSGAAAAGPSERTVAELGRWFAGALLGLLWCAAVLVGWRRLGGALSTPLQPLLLLCVGGLVVVGAVSVRLLWHRLPAEPKPWCPDWLVTFLSTVAVLSLGGALSLRETATGGLLAFWAMLIGEELWAWRPAVWRRLRQGRRKPAAAWPLRTGPPRGASPDPALPAVADDVLADDVLQQLVRSQAADGSERLSGWLRTRFAAGQRTASVHVAFCPPFLKTPELTVEQLDGPELRIKTAQLLPYGARLDLKLAAAAEAPLGVLLQFSARSNPPVDPTTGRQHTL